MKTNERITQETLKEVLSYDPVTGIFRWNIRPSKRVRIGDVAGTLLKKRNYDTSSTYIRIIYLGKGYAAHQLAWLYVTGNFPETDVDHQDNIGTNNSFVNLRLATGAENARNVGLKANNTSGVKGVYFHKRDQRWVAQVRVNGRVAYSKKFLRVSDAADAVEIARTKLHGPFTNHGRVI